METSMSWKGSRATLVCLYRNSGQFYHTHTHQVRMWAWYETISNWKGSWADVDWKCPTFLIILIWYTYTWFCLDLSWITSWEYGLVMTNAGNVVHEGTGTSNNMCVWICISVLSLLVQVSRNIGPLPVYGLCLCVCNHGAYADDLEDTVDQLLIGKNIVHTH